MDWLFKSDGNICNFRTAGVCIRDGKLFVQLDKRTGEYALPGGHVRFGETSEEALIREFKEEAGADIVCKRLVFTEECFWEWDGVKSHTIAFYYLIDFSDGYMPSEGFVTNKDNDDVSLGWVPLDELGGLTIYPEFIKREVFDLNETKHFISRE